MNELETVLQQKCREVGGCRSGVRKGGLIWRYFRPFWGVVRYPWGYKGVTPGGIGLLPLGA